MVNVAGDGRNEIDVPVFALPSSTGASPVTASLSSASPSTKRMAQVLPSRQIVRDSHCDSALTTETPTPCKPPDTL